jgi:Cu2+-exporting ATPase
MSAPAPADSCFHCGQTIPEGVTLSVTVDDTPRAMCCAGCAAVCQAILAAGLTDYYRHRSAPATTAREIVPAFLRETALYDHPAVQKSFVRHDGAHVREAALILEGITCAACVWLNERHLASLDGVLGVQINYSTQRAHVRWDARRIALSQILQAVAQIGYRAHPYDPGRTHERLEAERKTLLRRLGLAGVMTAQVMTLSEALYLGATPVTEHEFAGFFHWVSLLLTLPVLFYSATPFFRGAWNDLTHRRVGMDVPVVLGIVSAFAASVWTTLTGKGVAYFDSVTMFVFFLLGARYLEMMARRRSAQAFESLAQATPAMATRLDVHGAESIVPAVELAPGEHVRVKPGEVIPADGVVVQGASTVDESLLTGESLPRPKAAGAAVIGGAINVESPLEIRIDRTGPDTALSSILRLLDRAQAERPALAQTADRIAAWFVAAVLVLAALTAAYWLMRGGDWLAATIAVLVVTCPCALSLATPAALAAATGRLARLGLLATRAHALETLARATHFVFDKTGTLTRGQLRVTAMRTYSALPEAQCLQLAAALEQHSEHPIARAILAAAPTPAARATDVRNTPGAGLSGSIDGQRYWLGTAAFLAAETGIAVPAPGNTGATPIWLARSQELLAALQLEDEARPEAAALIRSLHEQGKTVWLLSGDQAPAVQRLADATAIARSAAALTPADKLARVKALQAQGAVVVMVGDGINDAPVLAGADLSIAMGNAAQIALVNADMVLLSQNLAHLDDGLQVARRALRNIRQNLVWAAAYNLVSVPLAALGYVPPWLAALGMSLSSLLVAGNALRLTRGAARAG